MPHRQQYWPSQGNKNQWLGWKKGWQACFAAREEVSWGDDGRAKETTRFCTEMLSLQKRIRAKNFPSSLKEVLETSWGHVSEDGQPAQKVSHCLALLSTTHRHCSNCGMPLWLKQVPQVLWLASPHPPVTVLTVHFAAAWQRIRQPFSTVHTAVKDFISNGSKG